MSCCVLVLTLPYCDLVSLSGIEKIRKAVEEAEALKKVKQKARERIQPKMGRMDVDYQVLHDAFFKWQTKPRLSGHGDLYYEGKEFEVHLRTKKPGTLSAALKAALGMPDGAPPPWLINMQRYGPPPSYPNLRIPGLNAPIPEGASFGYHPGGWGKPPVDEYGIPLYGDVFGARAALQVQDSFVPDKTHWGEIIVREDEYDEEDEEEEEDAFSAVRDASGARRERQRRREEATADDLSASDLASGIETPLGSSSVISGTETPSAIDLRKRTAGGTETPESSGIVSVEPPREPYRIIDEERTRGAHATSALFGSEKRYRLPRDDDGLTSADGGRELNDEKGRRGSNNANRPDTADYDDEDEDDNHLRKRKLDKFSDPKGKKQRDFKF